MNTKQIFAIVFGWLLLVTRAYGQLPVDISRVTNQHLFSYHEIYQFTDTTNSLSIADLTDSSTVALFQPNNQFNPITDDRNVTFWYKVVIQHSSNSGNNWVLEFFDQTIDEITLYTCTGGDCQENITLGDQALFHKRGFWHKNFIYDLPDDTDDVITYYVKIKSTQRVDVLIMLRTESWLFHYALDEYFFFGVFYGMILVFSFYNLIMFIAVRESHYFFYILYIVCVGLYEMSADGIGFQYIWPEFPQFNFYSSGLFLYLTTSFALGFSASVLNLRHTSRKLYLLVWYVFGIRTLLMLLGLTFFPEWYNYRFLEVLPFLTIYFVSFWRYYADDYPPARFLILGYSVVAFGIAYKVSQYMDWQWSPLGELSHYSLGLSFVLEMLLLSFAISDKISHLRAEKEEAQVKIIDQLHENQKLKDELNQNLEAQVAAKTWELVQKNEQIEHQNLELQEAYEKLAEQASEIEKINQLLEIDNERLQHDVAEEKEARAMSKVLDYEEFCALHPDDDSWMKFLADLKWDKGFTCKKCTNTTYSKGKSPYSHRCSKCGYEESVIGYTLLQNSRLPINKALYMIYLLYSSNGTISSHKLSEILGIRQSTCWAYSSKIKEAMKHEKAHGKGKSEGWSSIILTKD